MSSLRPVSTLADRKEMQRSRKVRTGSGSIPSVCGAPMTVKLQVMDGVCAWAPFTSHHIDAVLPSRYTNSSSSARRRWISSMNSKFADEGAQTRSETHRHAGELPAGPEVPRIGTSSSIGNDQGQRDLLIQARRAGENSWSISQTRW